MKNEEKEREGEHKELTSFDLKGLNAQLKTFDDYIFTIKLYIFQ
jgi:hypothetical protein